MSRKRAAPRELFEGRTAAEEPHEHTIRRLNQSSGVRYEELHETLRRLLRVPIVPAADASSLRVTSGSSSTSLPTSRQPPTSPQESPGLAPPLAPLVPVAAPASEQRPSDRAWDALMDGNQRWATGHARRPGRRPSDELTATAEPAPFAIVVGCMDSRVPVELVFDLGPGDVVVVRTAGQAIDELVIASVDFAQRAFATPLIVVLGHEKCAAAHLAVRSLRDHEAVVGAHDRAIVAALRSAYEFARARSEASPGVPLEMLVGQAQSVRVAQALREEPWLSQRILKRELEIRSAYYELSSGLVHQLE